LADSPIIVTNKLFPVFKRPDRLRVSRRKVFVKSPHLNESAGTELVALLAQVARQDRGAFAQLYDDTAARVYGLVSRIVRRPDAAEEVTSDVYMQVWQQAARFDVARGSPLAWILTIARSRALDSLRRRDPAEVHADPTILQAPAAADDPADLLQSVNRNHALHQAIAELAPNARQLLSLAFFRGLSHQEIADHTGMPLGTVKTVIRNAIQSLRPRLAMALEKFE
jgi:RNA polymerase sigma factor (sigma-70 family)